MKYSLRSLMMVVTLVAVVLSGRIAYLRHMAYVHQLQKEDLRRELGLDDNAEFRIIVSANSNTAGLRNEFRRHAELERDYRYATYRPWTLVNDWSSP